MVDDAAQVRAIYQALKAVDEVAAAVQTLHGRAAIEEGSTSAVKLLHQARERIGEGLRAIEADVIHRTDDISLRKG
jgi:hypothetical protein